MLPDFGKIEFLPNARLQDEVILPSTPKKFRNLILGLLRYDPSSRTSPQLVNVCFGYTDGVVT